MEEDKDEILLRTNGWEIECSSPLEIRTKDGSFASGEAAHMVLDALRSEAKPSPTYFVLRKANCRTFNGNIGKMDSDIIGVTTDEEYAKSKNSVFCYYEPVILLDR